MAHASMIYSRLRGLDLFCDWNEWTSGYRFSLFFSQEKGLEWRSCVRVVSLKRDKWSDDIVDRSLGSPLCKLWWLQQLLLERSSLGSLLMSLQCAVKGRYQDMSGKQEGWFTLNYQTWVYENSTLEFIILKSNFQKKGENVVGKDDGVYVDL